MEDANKTKKCSCCREFKLFSDFFNSKSTKDGKAYVCKSCQKIKTDEYHILHPSIKRKSRIKMLYNLSETEYEEIFIAQNGKCFICGKHQSDNKKSLSIDHSHETGKVRGLLCNNCNQGLGYFKDNIEFLENAIVYLKKSM